MDLSLLFVFTFVKGRLGTGVALVYSEVTGTCALGCALTRAVT